MNVFASGGSDRAARWRRDQAWLADHTQRPTTRLVPVWRAQSLIRNADPPRAVFLSPQNVGSSAPDPSRWILLGEHEDAAVFALEVEEADPGWPGNFVDLRQVGALLQPAEAALLAQAQGMVHWHRRHRFCGDCGHPTHSADAGYQRVCTNPGCGAQHFPRTDPAIIVLVTHQDRCLLARQERWPERVYGAVAGFVEPGESLEDAVAREVREETGLELSGVSYHSSQPWPFPSSLMAGFTATAATDRIRLDPEELDDARWFTRSGLLDALRTEEVILPSRSSIAFALVRDWLGAPV